MDADIQRDILRYVREERKRFRGVQQMMSEIERLLDVTDNNDDNLRQHPYSLALVEDFHAVLNYRASEGQLSTKALQRWHKLRPRVERHVYDF